MGYSCSDFTDSIVDALKVEIPTESNDSPSDQADICLEEIRRLQCIEKELRHAIAVLDDKVDEHLFIARVRVIADTNAKTEPAVIILRADEGLPIFKVQLQQYVEKTATAVVEAPTAKEARDKAYEIGATLTWTDGDDSYGVEAYCVLNANDEIVWER